MAFDGITTKSVIEELNTLILGGKINRIYEPNKNEIILDIYNKKKYLLNICIESSNCRINLTNYPKVNPKIAPNFCMVLRKYLNGAKIISLDTYKLDRIVIIELENYNELNDLVTYKLIVELMGKHSNIILLNKKDIIIDSMRHITSNQALRNISIAVPYEFPKSNKLNLLDLNIDTFKKLIKSKNEKNLINIFSNLFIGISKPFMIFTLEKLNIDYENFDNENLTKLYNYIMNILSNVYNHKVLFKDCIINNKKDFCITIKENTNNFSLNSFIDNFYYKKEMQESFINYRNTLSKLILSLLKKYNKKITNIYKKLDECKNIEDYKLYGELITANLYKINNNINVSNIDLENYYDNNKIITINLDNRFSPSLNAKNFFKKYNKLKSTLIIVTKQKSQIQNEISYLESIIYSLEQSTSIEDLDEIYQEINENIFPTSNNKKEPKVKRNSLEIQTLNINDFTVYVGKNNRQNDIITFRLSNKEDMWFHVQGFHGSHVVLKTNGKVISDDNPVLLKCAKLASLHSKANDENKVIVDYTLIKNVKKPKGSRPGFVVFNTYKSIIISN